MLKIVRSIWMHGRVFKPGQEEALEMAGLTAKDRRKYVRRGNIRVDGVKAIDAKSFAANETPALDYRTVDELRQIAKEKDIPYSGLRKDELIQALGDA